MLNKVKLFILYLSGFGLMVSYFSSAAAASKTAQPQGITISPAYQQVSIAADETQKPVRFSITNDLQKSQIIDISFSDFGTLSDTGGLFFIGSNPTDLQKKYGLSKWISIEPSRINLSPNQTINLEAVVQNLPDLSSGGHYGAINLSVASNQLQSLANNVAIHPVASTLIFLTKLGGDTHKLRLDNVSQNGNLFKLPTNVVLRFYNDGNTHLIPRGTASVFGPNGKLVSKGIINENSNIILPQTFRKISFGLNTISKHDVFGKYKLVVDYRFDGIDQFRTYQTSFYVIPALYLVFGLLVIVALVMTIKIWLQNKRKAKN